MTQHTRRLPISAMHHDASRVSPGILSATDLAPGLRTAGQQAARRAIEGRACVADLSSLHLLGLLDHDDRLRIYSALPTLTVARAAVDDVLLTRDHVRGVVAATYSASLAADGTIERIRLTAAEQVLLLGQAETLENIVGSAHARYPRTPEDAAAGAIALANEDELPFWCDDIVLRQRARRAGISAFGLLDLVTVLSVNHEALDIPAMLRRLADKYVVDLPLTADDITALATSHEWLACEVPELGHWS